MAQLTDRFIRRELAEDRAYAEQFADHEANCSRCGTSAAARFNCNRRPRPFVKVEPRREEF